MSIPHISVQIGLHERSTGVSVVLVDDRGLITSQQSWSIAGERHVDNARLAQVLREFVRQAVRFEEIARLF